MLGLALGGLGCVNPPSDEPTSPTSLHPNLLVILSDTHRFDHVSPADGGHRLTPNLALLARDGTRFTAATTPIPISAPAYATLLTGLPPIPREAGGHGLLNNHQRLEDTVPRLPTALRELGYRTAAMVANPFCSSAHGFGQGFDHFWGHLHTNTDFFDHFWDGVEGIGKGGEHITRQAIAWLDADADDSQNPAPFFLFAAYMDAHTPWVDATSRPSLLARVEDRPCCLLWAENSHVEQRIPFHAAPGRTSVTLEFVDDDQVLGTGLAVARAEPSGASSGALPIDTPSPLYIVEPRLSDARLRFAEIRGLEPAVEGSTFRRMARRARFVIVNPTTEPITAELRFHGYRRYGPDDSPRRYREAVRAADRHIGTLLGALEERGLDRDTVVVFLSDHGEMLGEHDAWGHVDHLWRETLHIPLVVKGPGFEPGGVRHDPFGLVDLHHLLLGFAAGPTDTVADEVADRGSRFAITYPPEAERLRLVARDGDLELHLDTEGHVALYDLATDPHQTHDLFPTRRDETPVRQMFRQAWDHLEEVDPGNVGGLEGLDAEQRRRLEALGYLDP